MLNHKHLALVAVVIAIVFLTIIVVHPRIFSPSNIGRNTGPMTTAPAAVPSNSLAR